MGNSVYDITDLSKFHPGGEKILIPRAGRQAHDLFLSVHDDCEGVKSLLEYVLIWSTCASKEKFLVWEKRLDQIVGIQNDPTNHSRFEKLPPVFFIGFGDTLCIVPMGWLTKSNGGDANSGSEKPQLP